MDSQDEFLIKENKSMLIENAKLIAKVEKLNVCDDSFANLKNENASLIAKIDKLKDRKSTRLNSSHITRSRMPSSA